MLGWLGGGEITVILILGLLLFGTTRLPKMARSVRLAIHEFKQVGKSLTDEVEGVKGEVEDAVSDVRREVTEAAASLKV
ncbi:MAG: twin-arginine translocase TatA/TatE family subunit [Gemmatimonadales bacterium]|nr:twin-arginine translocase TatA/TatE family subunit [Gemmatimonadales bacterium]